MAQISSFSPSLPSEYYALSSKGDLEEHNRNSTRQQYELVEWRLWFVMAHCNTVPYIILLTSSVIAFSKVRLFYCYLVFSQCKLI